MAAELKKDKLKIIEIFLGIIILVVYRQKKAETFTGRRKESWQYLMPIVDLAPNPVVISQVTVCVTSNRYFPNADNYSWRTRYCRISLFSLALLNLRRNETSFEEKYFVVVEECYITDKFSVIVEQRICISEVMFLSVLFNDSVSH